MSEINIQDGVTLTMGQQVPHRCGWQKPGLARVQISVSATQAQIDSLRRSAPRGRCSVSTRRCA